MKSIPTTTDRREVTTSELRPVTIRGRTELMPDNPHEIAKILKERRAKPAGTRARERLLKEQKRRGL